MISFGSRQQHQQHLGDAVAEYVDGKLNPAQEHRADLHLMICEHCRHAVQQEREIIAQLRSVSFDSGGHQQLMAGLLSLASAEPQAPGSPAAPAIPARRAPAVVTTSAPPQYQSARRSMACALAAVAGCVGVALVASTATGAASGPQPAQPGTGGNASARLVRQVPIDSAAPTRQASRPSAPLPLINQVAIKTTP
ncbi:zf-HC2 domain-containing protein [Flexivirga sp. ID2601S]|uniref:Zf-HC2 domain-containing protein n=1 Tax=Flexivirga aerilata TaxID=1656889 RepID=A0A849AHY8_9MICO|nr:zf-HC2 domain-containing protein [Flexivirga aerilata]NNG39166.1 zf-HC2 domain-containing protein [Flexivirga aerilata]